MVEISLTIPEGLLKSFVQLMGSLEGFFKHVSWKTKVARARAAAEDPEDVKKRHDRTEAFKREAVRVYDGFIAEGATPKEAVSATNKALKAQDCPWACYDIVFGVIRKAGRFKGQKRLSKVSKVR